MHIFKTKNLIIELGDWLANNSVKLGHISYIGASKELWFKFDIASLIIDKWERLLKVSWSNYHMGSGTSEWGTFVQKVLDD